VVRKMNRLRDRKESNVSSEKDKYRVIRVVDKTEAVASWALNKDRFASSLEKKVFSWSIQDIFNRDLLRHQVMCLIYKSFFTAQRSREKSVFFFLLFCDLKCFFPALIPLCFFVL
jgi:hypothetical protein